MVDCQNGQSIVIPQDITRIGRVFWSSDSKAFVITDDGNIGTRNFYVTDYENHLSKTVPRRLDILKYDAHILSVQNAFDISHDGIQVLMRVALAEPDTAYKLYIYNGLYPSKDHFIEDLDATNVIAASFALNDESKIWFFNEKGVVQYDLVTQQTTLINSAINSIDALNVVSIGSQAIFSPDGRYLATLGKEGLYLVDLSQVADQTSLHPTEAALTSSSKDLLRLTLTVDCPSSYTDQLTWSVINPNPQAITVTWQQRAFEANGTLVIPAGTSDVPGIATFQTNTAPPENANVIDLYANDLFQDSRYCIQR